MSLVCRTIYVSDADFIVLRCYRGKINEKTIIDLCWIKNCFWRECIKDTGADDVKKTSKQKNCRTAILKKWCRVSINKRMSPSSGH